MFVGLSILLSDELHDSKNHLLLIDFFTYCVCKHSYHIGSALLYLLSAPLYST